MMKKFYVVVFSFFVLFSCGYRTGVKDKITDDYPPSQVRKTNHPDSTNTIEGASVYEKDWEWGAPPREDENGKKEVQELKVEGVQ